MATKTMDPGTAMQMAWHQRMASMLHDHATWAALATVVVLVAKYLFGLHISETEVLSFGGIMASWLFGSSWVAKAHIDAMARIGAVRANGAKFDTVAGSLHELVGAATAKVATDLMAPTTTDSTPTTAG